MVGRVKLSGLPTYIHEACRLSSCEPTSVVIYYIRYPTFSFYLLKRNGQSIALRRVSGCVHRPASSQQPSFQLELQAALTPSPLRVISSLSNIPSPVWRPNPTPRSCPRVFSSQAGLSTLALGLSQWPLAAPPPQQRLRQLTFHPLLQLLQKKIAPAHSSRAPPTPSPVRLRRSLFTSAVRASKAASPAEEPLIHPLPDQKQTTHLGSPVVPHPPPHRPPSALSIMATRRTSADEVRSQTYSDGGALPLTRVIPLRRAVMLPHRSNPTGFRSTLLSPGTKARLRSRRPKAARLPLDPSVLSLYPQRHARKSTQTSPAACPRVRGATTTRAMCARSVAVRGTLMRRI